MAFCTQDSVPFTGRISSELSYSKKKTQKVPSSCDAENIQPVKKGLLANLFQSEPSGKHCSLDAALADFPTFYQNGSPILQASKRLLSAMCSDDILKLPAANEFGNGLGTENGSRGHGAVGSQLAAEDKHTTHMKTPLCETNSDGRFAVVK